MALTIEGVPETIKRADYLRLIESVGLSLDDLLALEFGVDAITAKVLARNENGRPYASAHGEVATHNICIRVEKDED